MESKKMVAQKEALKINEVTVSLFTTKNKM